MRAMVLEKQRSPLVAAQLPEPVPGPGQVLIRVHACGVCRTDLHIVDGELTQPKLPLVLGHQIAAEFERAGGPPADNNIAFRQQNLENLREVRARDCRFNCRRKFFVREIDARRDDLRLGAQQTSRGES